MKRFFESNLFYGIVSVGMAVFLLFYVASSENPITEKPFPNISVAVIGLDGGYLLEANPQPVEVRVSGYRSNINLTFPRDVKAWVDLSAAQPGTAEYPVEYTLPSGLSLVSIKPDFIELSIDVFEIRELPVILLTENAVPQGYSSAEPEVNPSSVTVSGPKRILDGIAEAVVSLDLAGRTRDFDGVLSIVLLDKDNQEFQDSRISFSQEDIHIHVGISENLASKSVAVRTPFSGNVNERYILAGVEVQPSTVKITGIYAAISTIEYLNTEAINLSPLTDTFHSFVRLLTPPNVEVLEGDMVEITIRIEKNLLRQTVENVPIEIRNIPEGFACHIEPAALDVTLSAFPDVFEDATVDGELIVGISAYIDLEDQPGVLSDYPVMLEVPEDYLVMQISEETVRLVAEIEEENEPD